MKKGYKKVFVEVIFFLSPFVLLFCVPILKSISKIGINERFSSEESRQIVTVFFNEHLSVCIIIVILIICAFLYSKVIKKNQNSIFRFGDEYMDYPYFIFFIAGKILKYETVDLKKVPIYMHAELIIRDTFKNNLYDDQEKQENDTNPIVKYDATDTKKDELTVVLIDTYPIEESNLHADLKITDRLTITKSNFKKGVRTYSPKFIETITEELANKEDTYKVINICGTINTKHSYEIFSKVFKKGGRGGFETLYVWKQDSNRLFDEKIKIGISG